MAKKINIPSTLFWIQPPTIFDVYYYRFTKYSDYFNNCDGKDKLIELPVFPPLNPIDFSFFVFDDVASINCAAKCHDPPDTPVDHDPSRQPAACARGQTT